MSNQGVFFKCRHSELGIKLHTKMSQLRAALDSYVKIIQTQSKIGFWGDLPLSSWSNECDFKMGKHWKQNKCRVSRKMK